MSPCEHNLEIVRLLASCMRSFAHAVRGDLSVLMNDLTYLATIVPAGETERLKTRCQSIATLLQGIGVLGQGVIASEPVSIGVISRECHVPLSDPELASHSITLDVAFFCRAMRPILVVLGSLLVKDRGWRLEASLRGLQTREFSFVGTLSEAAMNEPSSLEQFVLARLGEKAIPQIALCEIGLLAQGISLRIAPLEAGRVRLECLGGEVVGGEVGPE